MLQILHTDGIWKLINLIIGTAPLASVQTGNVGARVANSHQVMNQFSFLIEHLRTFLSNLITRINAS